MAADKPRPLLQNSLVGTGIAPVSKKTAVKRVIDLFVFLSLTQPLVAMSHKKIQVILMCYMRNKEHY